MSHEHLDFILHHTLESDTLDTWSLTNDLKDFLGINEIPCGKYPALNLDINAYSIYLETAKTALNNFPQNIDTNKTVLLERLVAAQLIKDGLLGISNEETFDQQRFVNASPPNYPYIESILQAEKTALRTFLLNQGDLRFTICQSLSVQNIETTRLLLRLLKITDPNQVYWTFNYYATLINLSNYSHHNKLLDAISLLESTVQLLTRRTPNPKRLSLFIAPNLVKALELMPFHTQFYQARNRGECWQSLRIAVEDSEFLEKHREIFTSTYHEYLFIKSFYSLLKILQVAINKADDKYSEHKDQYKARFKKMVARMLERLEFLLIEHFQITTINELLDLQRLDEVLTTVNSTILYEKIKPVLQYLHNGAKFVGLTGSRALNLQ